MRQRHFLTLPQSKERREKAPDRMWYEHGTNMVRTWYEEDFGKVFWLFEPLHELVFIILYFDHQYIAR